MMLFHEPPLPLSRTNCIRHCRVGARAISKIVVSNGHSIDHNVVLLMPFPFWCVVNSLLLWSSFCYERSLFPQFHHCHTVIIVTLVQCCYCHDIGFAIVALLYWLWLFSIVFCFCVIVLLGLCVALLLWFLLCRCGFIALYVVLVSLCLSDHFLLPTCQCGDGTTSWPTASEIIAVARITPCRVRNGVCVKTVMAFRTRASWEPLLDRLGVV